MRTISSSVHSSTPTANTQVYSPSVPLSVYRDLATELQAVQAKLDTLNAQNQQVVQENQLLRQEIAKAVESVLRLQNVVDSQAKVNFPQVSHPRASYVENFQTPVFSQKMEIPSSIPEPVFIEEQQVSYDPYRESEPLRIRSWWLIIGILFIIALGFSAGYLVVRPLFQSHSR